VALNPVIKFTTLFGLLAVELAVSLTNSGLATLVHVLAVVFFLVSAYFVWRSFYMMRIPGNLEDSIKAGSNQDDDDHLVPSPDAIPSPVNVPEPVAVGQK
jgi:K(+)-stimulated pyrophosphate-energized sodium pump